MNRKMFGYGLKVCKANEVCKRVRNSKGEKCGRRRKYVEISKIVSVKERKRLKVRSCCRFDGSKRIESPVSGTELPQ